jgi:hypothetical protein
MQVKVVYGTVTVDDQPVDLGQVIFVPIEDTKGPTSYSPIDAGSYRVEGPRGGVPLGTHRVEVVAKRKTGRKVPGRGGELTLQLHKKSTSIARNALIQARDRG